MYASCSLIHGANHIVLSSNINVSICPLDLRGYVREALTVTLIERYQSGEVVQAYSELFAHPSHPKANAIAFEIAIRVQSNLELPIERWRSCGFTLSDPIDQHNAAHEDIDRVEAKQGYELLAALGALLLEAEFINFVENIPSFEDVTKWSFGED